MAKEYRKNKRPKAYRISNVPPEIADLIDKDAIDNARTEGKQIYFILKQHYENQNQ